MFCKEFSPHTTGIISFSHPEKTHNDVFYNIALANATAEMTPEPFLAAIL
jgi:hypothetical protein